jgi:hypothetical protein
VNQSKQATGWHRLRGQSPCSFTSPPFNGFAFEVNLFNCLVMYHTNVEQNLRGVCHDSLMSMYINRAMEITVLAIQSSFSVLLITWSTPSGQNNDVKKLSDEKRQCHY